MLKDDYNYKILAECVGYAFEQCYSSNIMICREHADADDEEILLELKDLAVTFEQVCLLTDAKLIWDIAILERIKAATTLAECYE